MMSTLGWWMIHLRLFVGSHEGLLREVLDWGDLPWTTRLRAMG